MKKILMLPLAALLCFGCSKEAAQDDMPELVKQGVADKIVVGTAFYGATSSPEGNAKVNGRDVVYVSPDDTVTFEAFPAEGYEFDHWWLYTGQPPITKDHPIPPRENVRAGQRVFSKVITRENWYEPVFKPINPPLPPVEPIQLTVSVDPADARGEINFDYWDENGEHQGFSTREQEMPKTISVSPYSEVFITGYYKLDDPYGHYSYWIKLNDNYIDDGMPYMETTDFGFDYRVTIEPDQSAEQTLNIVINKPSFP